MFISSKTYDSVISDAVGIGGQISIAVAFWGRGSEKILEKATGNIRIICNLLSGGTNPQPIIILMGRSNVEIKHSSKLHAKVMLCDDRAIVGSANYSTNGLHYEEGELYGWDEAGIETRDPGTLVAIGEWFEELWLAADTISKQDIENAKKNWEIARQNRFPQSTEVDLLSLPVDVLKDRAIYVVFYMDEASPEASRAFDSISGEVSGGHTIESGMLSFYEDWGELPKNSILIDVRMGSRFSLKVGGIYTRIPELDKNFKYNDKKSGSIQVVLRKKKVPGYIFNAKTKEKLVEIIRPKISKIMSHAKKEKDTAKFLSLYDLLTNDVQQVAQPDLKQPAG